MKPWEAALNGVAILTVVVFVLFVGIQLVQNVTADPVEQIRVFEESHDHPSTTTEG